MDDKIKTIRDALFYACNALEAQLEGCEDEELISQNQKALYLIEKLLKRKRYKTNQHKDNDNT